MEAVGGATLCEFMAVDIDDVGLKPFGNFLAISLVDVGIDTLCEVPAASIDDVGIEALYKCLASSMEDVAPRPSGSSQPSVWMMLALRRSLRSWLSA